MKRKLQDIIQEKFTYEDTHLLLPDLDLNFTAIESEPFEGTFSFHSSNDHPIRGIVSCEHPCVTCLDTEFNGTDIQIRFRYADSQQKEGMADQGVFVITSNVGEYLLPFRANITRRYLMSSIGKIKTLNDFTNLCKLSWKEALQIFKSRYFCNILHHDSGFQKLLYRGLTEHACGAAQMEEFLVGCGKKERNRLIISRPQRGYKVSKGSVLPQSDLLDVEKSTWGYVNVEISCDAAFVRLEKQQLRYYDFVGKHAEVQYHIMPGLLHGGKNYAKIRIQTPFQEETIEIAVTVLKERSAKKSAHWENRYIHSQMEKYYLDYRREELSKELWMQEMEVLLKRAISLDPENEWLPLYRIFVLLTGGDKLGAEAISEKLPKNIQNQRTPLGAFYLYLTTVGETPAYCREVTRRVKEIYLKYPSHPVLVWVLLHIDEVLLRNPERKYQWIRKYMLKGNISPIFYEEAACLLENHPEMLHEVDMFERRLLIWMMKHNRLSPRIINRLVPMAQLQKTFDPIYFRVLCRCYRQGSETTVIKNICIYLIKCNRYGTVYFPWFQRGISCHLKIAGLYEGYMLSWTKANGALPEEILHYFVRSKALPAKRRAMLYAYVVRNKERIGKIWQSYQPVIREFASQELKKEHMSEDLAVIYEDMKKQLTEGAWNYMRKSADDAYRIRVPNPDMTELRVLQADSGQIQKVALYERSAYVYLHTKPFAILYADQAGNVYTAGKQFHLKKMLSGVHVYQKDQTESEQYSESTVVSNETDLAEQIKIFEAPMAVMQQRIAAVREEGMDTADAEEKLLLYMLFTGNFLPGHEQLFERIVARKGEPLLLQAYMTWFSYQYLLEKAELPTQVHNCLREEFLAGRMHQRCCQAAFLKKYVKTVTEKARESLRDTEETVATKLLEHFLLKGMYFQFYQELPAKLQRKYLLFGENVISCVAQPEQVLHVTICTQNQEKIQSAGMQEVLPGLYTCVIHTYFAQNMEYEVATANGEVLEHGTLVSKPGAEYTETRYGRLFALMEKKDKQSAYEYAELTDLADALFLPIEE